MKVFDAMGDRIEERRSGLNYDERVFPGLAIDTIAETPELREFSANEIVDWVLESRRLPAQFDWRSRFGEPPITLHSSERFVIDAYFWLGGGTTSTHQPLALDVLHDLLPQVPNVAALIAVARARHGERIDAFEASLTDVVRTQELTDQRSRLRHPEHRFLFALLLNLPDRRSIDALIRRRHPRRGPPACILRWIGELAQTTEGDSRGNALGIPLDEASLQVLEDLLRGRSDAEIYDLLMAEFVDEDGDQRALLVEMCAAFRSSLLFGRLFK